MKLRIIAFLIAIPLQFQLYAQDLQTVLINNNEAIGIESRNKIANLQTNGHVIMSGTDAKIPFKLIQSKPDRLRIETMIFGFKTIQTYDGISAWLLSPTQGMEAVRSDARDMEFIAAATAIDGPFSVNKNNKYKLSYAGKDTYQDKAVHVVLWSTDEERLRYYINGSTWLIDGLRYEYKKNGGWYSMEYRIMEYLDFQGSAYPRTITGFINGVEMLNLFITGIKEIKDSDPAVFGKPSFNM
ncbi:MAG: hypothetical protein K9J30_04140 [Bacteroidales bacterium]|nr:hypothetical protein [Bacteroidales bacterium]